MQEKATYILTKKDLIQGFQGGCKPRSDFKVGIEYERILIDKQSFKTVPYLGESGVYRLLRQLAFQDEWHYITDFGQLIGLQKGENYISLEPGGQLELSMAPKKSICEIENEINRIDTKLLPIAHNLGIIPINYGISPVSTYNEIQLIPKKRYEIMAKNLPGDHHHNMMRETAGIQCAIDYESEEDAIKKLKLALMLSPITTAIFANSPIYEEKASGFKSYRALSWLFTDNKRCGLISKKLFEQNTNFTFSDYVDILLDIPMLFIIRGNQIIEINGKINFETFIKQGFEDETATLEDFKLHSNMFFPETRLNSYLEIRNHDCQTGIMKYAIPAIYKGIFSNNYSMNEIFEILKNYSYEDFAFARECVPRQGLQAKLGKHYISDIAKEILKIAYSSLYKIGLGEQKYLEYPIELVEKGLTPADIILKNWHGHWNRDISKLIEASVEIK